MRQITILLLMGGFIALLSGCSASRSNNLPSATQRVVDKAQAQGFVMHRYATPTFAMTTYERFAATPAHSVHVYIEGDGHSWKSRYQLSDNPTPRQPLALSLAMQDPHQHVIYIARPCQYTPLATDPLCQDKFWSSHRYAPEVITATNDVFEQVKTKLGAQHFTVIGFSGGASVTMLVAAQRKDVAHIYTVAGDLNHVVLSQYHDTTPLTNSLNPIEVINQVKDIPQDHWCGTRDTTVPCWTIKKYVAAENNPKIVKFHTLKGAGHHKGWEKAWRGIIIRGK